MAVVVGGQIKAFGLPYLNLDDMGSVVEYSVGEGTVLEHPLSIQKDPESVCGISVIRQWVI